MKWNLQESNDRAYKALGDIADDLEIAETLWYLETDDPTSFWLQEVMGFEQIDYTVGEDEAWIYLWQDRTKARYEPTLGMIFYVDWYAYKGFAGAERLILELRAFHKLALRN